MYNFIQSHEPAFFFQIIYKLCSDKKKKVFSNIYDNFFSVYIYMNVIVI